MASMDSALDDLKYELTQGLSKYTARGTREYESVRVLLLFWADDDLGVLREVLDVTAMFRDVFHYDVIQFVIPSERSEASLSREINSFVYEYGLEDSLLIIYYSGHADPDRDGNQESIWAA